ncbi:hypothetical protein ABZU25_06670 [Micromonospora sp. NPDC005215]
MRADEYAGAPDPSGAYLGGGESLEGTVDHRDVDPGVTNRSAGR